MKLLNSPMNRRVLFAVVLFFSHAMAEAKESGLCRDDERVQFSCHIKTKIVSLCATGNPGALTALSYRYGTLTKVENEFMAQADNANRFFATASPASPRALIKQIWFDRGDIRYLLTECVGGDCPQDGGLAVLRGNKVLMNERCMPGIAGDQPGFDRTLITFGDQEGSISADAIQSTTELLKIEDSDNELQQLFRQGAGSNMTD